jgi:hypothetical protein
MLLLASVVLAPCAVADTHSPLTGKDLWISPSEIEALPTEGPAWQGVLKAADQSIARPRLDDQNDPTNVRVLARALVYARTGDTRRRKEVVEALDRVRGTEREATALAVSRELIAYVIAADLVRLEGAERETFETWLRSVQSRSFAQRTLRSTHEDRPNNWGTHAGATRIAIALYLRDQAELARSAHVFRGWLGEKDGWRGFDFGDGSWQAGFFRRHAINPAGSSYRGHSLDGVLPDDQRRGGPFRWPPPKENYVYEALQGAVSQAVLLERAGYDVWSWGDRALLRAFRWLHEEADFVARGDDTWLPPILNRAYGTRFPAPQPSQPGKGMGFADWTHASPPVTPDS